jgi:thiamine-monophosphate kinase
MVSGEFNLIERFFDRLPKRSDVVLAVGDDCALLEGPRSDCIAVSVDTLVSGVHFFPDVSPRTLGHKALAVNLSDLAASGAEPRWCTLALTLPEVNEDWISAFSEGFYALAQRHQVDLVGGDTSRGPLSITVQVMGSVPRESALLRSGACPGDLIYVSGPIGSAGLALKALRDPQLTLDKDCLRALEQPLPRTELGIALRGYATACIDISDGLVADLGHILHRSEVGADLVLEQIPFISAVQQAIIDFGDPTFALTAGDDYELCFTVPARHRETIEALLIRLDLAGQCVGQISTQQGLRIHSSQGPICFDRGGYEHFS